MAATQANEQTKVVPAAPKAGINLKNFLIGGFAGMCATTFVQPIDIVKVRIQILAGENPGKKFGPLGVARDIMAQGGFRSFYAGYDSALMRQATYTTARFGIFNGINDFLKERNGGGNLPTYQKMFAGLAAGGLGSLVGCPADLILIRMQADTMLPLNQRRNYKSVFDAAIRIPREEGITSLWKGGVPTMVRAMALNLAMFTLYEDTKERMARLMPNNKSTGWVIASFIAGSGAALASLPFDNAKTKLQKQKPDANGNLKYRNIFHCMGKEIANNGPMGLYAGAPTYCMRIAPHIILTLLFSEQIKKMLS